MTGTELFLKLKEMIDPVPLAILCPLGFDPAPQLAKARQAGLRATLPKPFRAADLIKTLERFAADPQP